VEVPEEKTVAAEEGRPGDLLTSSDEVYKLLWLMKTHSAARKLHVNVNGA